ncbi:serine protease [Roseiconus nitratireducens]|uniref:Serine protease n=1 Tax=Roseiconus nitratireducens TaxID=2605748 RepID=A0A5M6D2S3_9BACT|nr:PPC domain-containing protein [Roseiconus nitratireducens]KAA5541788.1 serine protease [Roseiconus nitratireducens]
MPQSRMLWLATMVFACPWPASVQAQVKLDRIFPPVVAVGAAGDLTAEGEFPSWPAEIICDRTDLEWSVGDKPGQLHVRVPAESAPGVAWIRLHDATAATSLVPLLVSTAPVTVEHEPNDRRSEANALTLPCTVAGRLAKRGDSDAFRVPLKQGDRLVVSATAHQVLRSPMDAVLQLTDPQGNVLAQSDDVRGLDPQLVYEAPETGDVLIRIFAFPETPNSTIDFSGSPSFVYVLDVTTGAFLDHAVPGQDAVLGFGYGLPSPAKVVVQPATDVSPPVGFVHDALGWCWLPVTDEQTSTIVSQDAKFTTLPAIGLGHLSGPDDLARFRFEVRKGQTYRAAVDSRAMGYPIDSNLSLYETSPRRLIVSNDDASRSNFDAELKFTAEKDSEVEVVLSDRVAGFGPRHLYRLHIAEFEPDFRLSVAEDHFNLSADGPAAVTVSVDRDRGFDAMIRVSAMGLPDGVTCESVISEAKGDTAKKVTLKLMSTGKKPRRGSFQIVGAALNGEKQPGGLERKAALALRPAVPVKTFSLTGPAVPE